MRNKEEFKKDYFAVNAEKDKFVFFLFCVWTFVFLCRPQNYIPALLPLRPVLSVMVIFLIFYFINIKNYIDRSLFENNQIKRFIFLFLIIVISIPFALHVRVSFNSVFPGYFVSVIYLLIFYKVVNSKDKLVQVFFTVCFGSGLYFLMAAKSGLGSFGRLFFSTTFDPNDLAFFVLVFLPINFYFINKDNPVWKRAFCIISLVCGFLLIFLCQSRGGFIAFVLAMSIFLFNASIVPKAYKIVSIFLITIVLMAAPVKFDRFSTILDVKNDYNLNSETGRIALWGIGIRWMISDPLTGVGVNNFARAVGLDRQRRELDILRWQAPHNSLIQIGTETGLIGLFLYCLLSFNVIKILFNVKNKTKDKNIKKLSELLFVGFVGMFTASMFLSQAYSVYWVFYVALSATLNRLFIEENKIL